MIYLLDTDIFILLLRGSSILRPRSVREEARQRQAASIRARCRRCQDGGHEVGLSAITLAELEFGLCHGEGGERHRSLLQRILAPFSAHDFDTVECVRCYGEIRAGLEAVGGGIGPLDTLIAAHARALGATLVTHNTREFGRVSSLRIEDWSAG